MKPGLLSPGPALAFCMACQAPLVGAVENPAVVEAAPAAAQDRDERDRFLAEYQRRIQEREAEHGAYDPALGEYLLSAGLVYQENGQHEEAVRAFERSLQIKRVNEGLYGIGQVAVLEQLVQGNIAAARWEAVDQNYRQLLWVHQRNYAAGDPRLLPVIDLVGRWKLKAYAENLLDRGALTTIAESEKLFGDTVRILQRQYGENDPSLVNPLYGRALTNYQYAIEVANTPQGQFRGAGSPTRTQVVCRAVPAPNGGSRRVCHTISVPNPNYYAGQAQSKDFALGQRLGVVGKSLQHIVRIHETHPELDRGAHARALTHLGDWNLLRDRRTTAFRNYKSAYQLLSADDEYQEVIEELFGKPQKLPALRLPLPGVDEKVASEKVTTVAASFDVSRSGRARNVKIIESDPADAAAARRKARKTIRERIYRPRFENGEPVATLGNKIRIRD